jgi:hypothetical protein
MKADGIRKPMFCVAILAPLMLVQAQVADRRDGKKPPPKFEDFPVAESWHGSSAPVKLTSPSERMFRTQLGEAAKKPPDFAGHYRFTDWGCGTRCSAGGSADGTGFSSTLG